ncbi:MAG: TonB-dependent receptor, partial [Bryobacteraceae bacterium]
VSLRKIATNETFTATTNASGDYRVFPLPLGEYELRASFSGFKTEVRSGIVLAVGRIERVDFALSLGETTQTVEITSRVSLLNTESAGMGQVIDHEKLVGLPVNNRDFATLAALSPGVVSPRGTIYGNGVASGTATGILVRGMSRADNVYHLDGSMISEGNGATTFRPNLDALQEFEVKTGLYGAEYGVRPGGQIIAVTKSGTNQLHGNAFWFSRNQALDARNFFQRTKTDFKRQQLGATIGGPITIPKVVNGKDRAWFFFAFQDEIIRSFVPLTGIVPTAAQKTGQFTTAIRDPLTGQPFANNLIPASRINPVAQKFLKFWPEPNTPGALNFTSPNSTANSDNPQYIAKVDFRVSDNDRWSARYAQNTAFMLTIDAISEFSFQQPFNTYAQEVTNTRTFKNAYVNVASFHFFRRPYYLGVPSPHTADAISLGIPDLSLGRVNPSGGLPRVSITGFLAVGDAGSPPGGAVHIGNWQAKDDFSFQKAAHFLKIGGEFRRHYNFYNIGASPGVDFQARYSGNAFADFLLGTPSSTRTGGESNRGRFAQNGLYTYVQDDWKISKKLTLNLGLRYELRGDWIDKSGFMSNYNPYGGVFIAPVQNLTLKPWETGRFQPNVPLIEWAKTGFLPRVGLAYRLNDKTVIRTGYGMYANDIDVAILQELGNQPRTNAQVSSFNANIATSNISLSDPFPAALAATAVARYNGVETPLKLTMTHSWGLSIQREIYRNLSIDLGYQGSHTSNRLETVS